MESHSEPPAPCRLRARNVVTPAGVRDAVVEIAEGRIAAVIDAASASGGAPIEDLGDLWLLPGLVDTHVHVNDPGRAEWEGFPTATRAAAVGGITTIVDMPLNSSPATCSVAALEAKRAAARGRCHVDVAFWGGVVPGNARELEPLAQAGVAGFKCFLSPSGVDDFPHVTEGDLREAMPVIAKLGLPLLVHAELPAVLDAAAAAAAVRDGDPRLHATWLASRPPAAECEAIALLIRLCRETGCRVHIVHLATAEALPMLRVAKNEGLPITVETCPHYLVFDAEAVRPGATEFKCAPPIRGRANREALGRALVAGEIDLVATDHSPCPPAMKLPEAGDFLRAWGGIASLEVALSALASLPGLRPLGLEGLARLMSAAPARLAGLAARKGAIAPGHDADLVAFQPSASWRVEAEHLQQRHKVTPYADRAMLGVVVTTWLRGEIAQDHWHLAEPPRGELLLDAARVIR